MKTSPPEGVRAMGAFRAHTTLRASVIGCTALWAEGFSGFLGELNEYRT